MNNTNEKKLSELRSYLSKLYKYNNFDKIENKNCNSIINLNPTHKYSNNINIFFQNIASLNNNINDIEINI